MATLLCNNCMNVFPADIVTLCEKCDSDNVMWVDSTYLNRLQDEVNKKARQIDFEKLKSLDEDEDGDSEDEDKD